MLQILNFLAGFFLICMGFFVTAEGTWVETFFNWLHLGGLMQFCLTFSWLIIPALLVLYLLKWIRDWRILLGVFIVALIFYFSL